MWMAVNWEKYFSKLDLVDLMMLDPKNNYILAFAMMFRKNLINCKFQEQQKVQKLLFKPQYSLKG